MFKLLQSISAALVLAGVSAGVARCQRSYFVALRTFIDGTVPSLMALGERNCCQQRA
jgi:hypothetical protein